MSRGRGSVLLPPRLRAGKAAFRELVAAFGGQVAAADETGKSQSRICDYGHRNCPDFAPIDVVVRLESETAGCADHPAVTRWMARQAGFALVKLPDVEFLSARSSGFGGPPDRLHSNWGLLVSNLAKEAGTVTSGICADLADDNDVSPEEARQRLTAAAELVRVAVALEHALRVRALDEASPLFAWGRDGARPGDPTGGS